MAQRKAGKGNFRHELGTRRDAFFRKPIETSRFREAADHNGDSTFARRSRISSTAEIPRALRTFLLKMHERAARFDPFPTS